ncbi:MAG: hypothetical protein FWG98_13710 [Candidatus Cloacimonetes bacterium]|nr:hypothetical protein [Candidatus Cloacimonadota bacterium]
MAELASVHAQRSEASSATTFNTHIKLTLMGFSSSTNDKTLNDFIRSYSRYGLKILTSARLINYFRLSFNPSLISE